MEHVQRCNHLLQILDIRVQPYRSFDDLRSSASSMFVAVARKTLGPLKGITGPPIVDHTRNAQIVIDALGARLGIPILATGDGIVHGDVRQIAAVLTAFEDILGAPQEGEQDTDDEEDVLLQRTGGGGGAGGTIGMTSRAMSSSLSSLGGDSHLEGSSTQDDMARHRDELEGILDDDDDHLLGLGRHVEGDEDGGGGGDDDLLSAEQTGDSLDELQLLNDFARMFPEQTPALQRNIRALRKYAQHRTEAFTRADWSSENRKKALERERMKHVYVYKYEQFLQDERRETMLAAQRRALRRKLAERQDAHMRRVEQLRLKRLAEDLAREAQARRLRRRDKEESLVRDMLNDAVELERARIDEAKTRMEDEMKREHQIALSRFESLKTVARHRVEMMQEKLEAAKRERVETERHRTETLSKLTKEMREEVARKIVKFKQELDRKEQETFVVNTHALEKAFSLLNDSSTALWRARSAAFS